MPENGSRVAATTDAEGPMSWPGPEKMGYLHRPPLPSGLSLQLANRALVYLRPEKLSAVLPWVDPGCSGMILAGREWEGAMHLLRALGASFPVVADPEGYRRHTATVEEPFWLPGAGGLLPATLQEVLDAQLRAGAVTALTPTGYIPAAGTDELKAAIRQFTKLGEVDAIFVAPLDISLLGGSYFPQTAAILAELERPVALVLGCQGNPLDQRKEIITNLRALAHRIPLAPIRTDLVGLDLSCQGAVFTAIGTGGSLRHTVDPAEKDKARVRGTAPSVLWPELLTIYKGSTIAEFFGAREHLAPVCNCGVCGGRRITRFLRREQQDEAISHGIASWLPLAARLLTAGTMRARAETWKETCRDAVEQHQAQLDRLQRIDGLRLEPAVRRWSALPAWPDAQPPRPEPPGSRRAKAWAVSDFPAT
jgi:hypothetical protein